MRNQPLRYYMHDGPSAFRFELAGDLDRDGAERLDQDWQTASSVIGGRSLIVDLTFITGLDTSGSALIARWHREGAQIVAKSKLSKELASAALGKPIDAPPRVTQPAQDGTWAPFRTSLSMIRKIASHVARVEPSTRAENTSSSSAVAHRNSPNLNGFDKTGRGLSRAL
jgi:ABC-type transporter Mla MlaB component